MSDHIRGAAYTLAVALLVTLAIRGVLSIIHDGWSPDWLWP